jgi:NAD(P)-dependent dehydrogenase (short-subunit alcohol dehydrogenase family)
MAAATARLGSGRGDGIFLIGKCEDECRALSAELKDCAFFVADVADENSVRSAVERCLSHYSRIDAVFNAAGLSGRALGDAPLHECSTPAWQTMMNVHATGTFFVCREVLKNWMAAKQPGTILNMGSVLARHPERRFFATHAYPASKGAVESMTLAAAGYYAPHRIRMNVLAPSLVRTPMSKRAQENPAILEFMKQKQPLTAGLIEANDVARVAYFLLSNESFPITGEVVRVDAGWAVTG